ncbi:hypothetical protein QBC42DRAFT_237978 [Cladorrhinum samala]|uniref:Uncharacterized protein n=1 Tax=Cladorrhinum samala TaxID=585594 RepID=A0AAV9H8C4_9PEZI|nr:hypothetical protein QBC42DRAFT_237978 [Cladorrhinum samala]
MKSYHHHSSTPGSSRAVDPPRPAREGEYSRPSTPNKSPDSKIWKRRRRSRKSQSNSGGNGHDSEGPTSSPKTLQMSLAATLPMTPQSPYLSEEAHVYSLQNPRQVSASQDDQDGEWLSPKHRRSYASSCSYLNEEQMKKSEKSESSEQSQPDDVKLDTVKKFLDRLPEAEKPEPDVKASAVETTKSRRVRFGRVLWRKASGRAQTATSTSRADQEQPARPSPPQIWLSQFPGGEATRVHTPPYKEDTADGRPRGLFFDVNNPTSRNTSNDSDSTTTSTRRTHSNSSSKRFRDRSRSPVNPGAKGRKSPASSLRTSTSVGGIGKHNNASSGSISTSKEWWEQQQHLHQQAGRSGTPVQSNKGGGRERCRTNPTGKAALFEFDVPEHLPSSPMCPANPKNVKSAGKGVCVVSNKRHGERTRSRGQVS